MSKQTNNKGRIVIISGPSGVGKSTICKEVMKRVESAYLSVSVTTRPKSESEIDGDDYWFITEQEFQEQIRKGLLLEHAEVFGNLYGTPKDKVEEALAQGRTVILEIDVQGANGRGREERKAAEVRLDMADDEIAAAWQHYDHMVINDDLEQAVREVTEMIERCVGGKE
ncbi:MAG: guanylate kinase [Planctomycetota bacterium]|jgi:guanylate kinase